MSCSAGSFWLLEMSSTVAQRDLAIVPLFVPSSLRLQAYCSYWTLVRAEGKLFGAHYLCCRKNQLRLTAWPCSHTYCLGHLVVGQLDLIPAYRLNRTDFDAFSAFIKDSFVEFVVNLIRSMNFIGGAVGSDFDHSSYCTWRQACNLSFSWQQLATDHLTCMSDSSTCLLGNLEPHESALL